MTIQEFEGRTAMVTGAASGIGRAIANMFAAGGARVVGVDRDAGALAETMRILPSTGAAHMAIVQDLRVVDAAKRIVADATANAGSLDILVNSAGVCHFTPPDRITPEEWDEVVETDLKGLYYMAVAGAEAMDARRGGRIINIGSNAGRKGRRFSAHYAAAKAGVINLTESLALAYGEKNITVNTVCPAVVLTPLWESNFKELGQILGKPPEQLMQSWVEITPLKRLATVEDVAHLVAFLASGRAACITGQAINVCGGFMLTC